MLNYMVSYGGRYIYPDRRIQTEYDQICSDQMDKTIRRFFTEICLVWPVYKLIKYGVRTTLTEVKIPFVDEDSDTEYILNLMAQVVIITFAGLAHF